ncbi:type VII secretion protein EccE [Micromonospora sp. DR5-3]|uniref:type VII secretion protein EccE n=1 Tax=unclassified Micromonospora TaxID=2617518 RepID=UPI0011D4C2EE|nr:MULTISPECIES: type VII secretion protein EccE [unclassified Micromonospora]MCW3815934.1 type VII secretion protein EccE [Micromonospora sp. DR5-3]TYC24431.1 type VII secretion protein EccE [Micromonospora sp. MP36]
MPAPPVGPRRWLGLGVGRLVLWQCAVLVVVAVGGPHDAVSGTLTGLAAVVALAAGARWQGRWLPDWVVVRHRYRRRARRTLVALPVLPTRTYADRAGNRVGLAGDGRTWSALLRVEPGGDLDDLLCRLLARYDDPDLPLAGAQLVDWTSPGTGNAARWIAVRLDPRMAARAVRARGGGQPGAVRAVGTAALRLVNELRAAGHQVTALDGGQLRDAWATVLGVDPRRADEPGSETWRYWSLGMLHQVCYRPRRAVRDRDSVLRLLRRHATPPALVSAVSVRWDRQRGGGTRSSALIRVGVPAGPAQEAVADAVRQATAGFDRTLVPLHGAHAEAARETLPLAGLRVG